MADNFYYNFLKKNCLIILLIIIFYNKNYNKSFGSPNNSRTRGTK